MLNKHWLAIGASILLGLVFVVAGLGKLLQPAEAFKIFFTSYPAYLVDFLTPAFFKAIFTWLPHIELQAGRRCICIGLGPNFAMIYKKRLLISY